MTDTSDEATGLTPLTDLEANATIVVEAWNVTEGLVSGHLDDDHDSVAVRYLHVRGLIKAADGGIKWAQIHVAIPTEHVVDIAAQIAMGVTS